MTLDKRATIQDIIKKVEDKTIENICVESVRAISIDANVAEQIYQDAKANNLQVVPSDFPDLCVLDPNPVQTFIRKVMFAMTELEKNLIVQRLQDGQQKKEHELKQKYHKHKKKVAS